MKKMMRLLTSVGTIAFLGFVPTVNAVSGCDYETQIQISNEAANVNVNYEAKRVVIDERDGSVVPDGTDDMVTFEGDYAFGDMVTISIMNITSNLTIEVTGENGFFETYTYEDSENGTVVIDGGHATDIIKYDIRIKSNHNDCKGEEFGKQELITPKKNEFSNLFICEESNEYYCQEYVTTEVNMTESEIIDRENSKKKVELPEEEKESWFSAFLKENKNTIILGGIIIVIGVTSIVIVIKKKQRSRII